MAMVPSPAATWLTRHCQLGAARLKALHLDAGMTTKDKDSLRVVALWDWEEVVSPLSHSWVPKQRTCSLTVFCPSPTLLHKPAPSFSARVPSLSGGAKTLPLIKSSIIPTFWYIPITGITLNGKALDIPPGTFDLQSDGSGGMIIDSGTTVTILDQVAYSPLKEAIQSAIDLTPVDGSSTGLDLCYHTSSAHLTLPTLVFNFKGGVYYEFPADNFFIQASENLLCLAMLGEPSGNPSIFGNIQQQNFHILYNNAQNTLSFKPTKCDSL
ncbi:aspartic proteinase nepenthesin-1-like [Cryptomeria japonica]|uniref:aspartic proteinase nepenthesin-1-like n=1 Tax=Cryptomeria japonica TaxID=3369 RepID=UPI0027DAA6EE|nr:aspartic proteinase nepenthesin-1-like [Cryptomeria japonica]